MRPRTRCRIEIWRVMTLQVIIRQQRDKWPNMHFFVAGDEGQNAAPAVIITIGLTIMSGMRNDYSDSGSSPED
jgi:hypothetical protein